MSFKKNNQFWKARAKNGRDKIFQTPELLWEAAAEYFEWCDTTPLQGEKILPNGKRVKENLMRPYTVSGLCLFIGIAEITWGEYRKRPDFAEMCTKIDATIWTQKFSGAATNLLNANLISRDLGLIDRQGLELSKAPDRDYSALSDEELKQLIFLEQKMINGKRNIESLPGIVPEKGL